MVYGANPQTDNKDGSIPDITAEGTELQNENPNSLTADQQRRYTETEWEFESDIENLYPDEEGFSTNTAQAKPKGGSGLGLLNPLSIKNLKSIKGVAFLSVFSYVALIALSAFLMLYKSTPPTIDEVAGEVVYPEFTSSGISPGGACRPAGSYEDLMAKYGFYAPQNPDGEISSRITSHMEEFKIEAEKASKWSPTELDPVMVVWWTFQETFRGESTDFDSFNFSFCQNGSFRNYSVDFNCPYLESGHWQLGYGQQFGDTNGAVFLEAWRAVYGDPEDSDKVQQVGQNILDKSGQTTTQPPFPKESLISIYNKYKSNDPKYTYLISVLMRDQDLSAYLLSRVLFSNAGGNTSGGISNATFRKTAFGWHDSYRTAWQSYSNLMYDVWRTWNNTCSTTPGPEPANCSMPTPPDNQLKDQIQANFGINMSGPWSTSQLQTIWDQFCKISNTQYFKIIDGATVKYTIGDPLGNSRYVSNELVNVYGQFTENSLRKITIHELAHIIRYKNENIYGTRVNNAVGLESWVTYYAANAYRCTESNSRSENYADMITYYLLPNIGDSTALCCPPNLPNPYAFGQHPLHYAIAKDMLGNYP